MLAQLSSAAALLSEALAGTPRGAQQLKAVVASEAKAVTQHACAGRAGLE